MTYREARERAGLTLTEAAAKLEVTKAAVSIWENGKGNPQVETLKKVARLYGVTVDELLTDDAEKGA